MNGFKFHTGSSHDTISVILDRDAIKAASANIKPDVVSQITTQNYTKIPITKKIIMENTKEY